MSFAPPGDWKWRVEQPTNRHKSNQRNHQRGALRGVTEKKRVKDWLHETHACSPERSQQNGTTEVARALPSPQEYPNIRGACRFNGKPHATLYGSRTCLKRGGVTPIEPVKDTGGDPAAEAFSSLSRSMRIRPKSTCSLHCCSRSSRSSTVPYISVSRRTE